MRRRSEREGEGKEEEEQEATMEGETGESRTTMKPLHLSIRSFIIRLIDRGANESAEKLMPTVYGRSLEKPLALDSVVDFVFFVTTR